LPEGATLVLQQFSWDDYERLLDRLRKRRHLRVSYDSGRIEVMSPLPKHEKYARFIDQLVRVFADHLDVELESYGSTTWKRRALDQGIEADSCYYVAGAASVIGKDSIDLECDPPPDIAVEVDITNESLSKFGIYAAYASRKSGDTTKRGFDSMHSCGLHIERLTRAVSCLG